MKAYDISYKHRGVYQAIIVMAESKHAAERYMRAYKPKAEILNISPVKDMNEEMKKGKPILTAYREE